MNVCQKSLISSRKQPLPFAILELPFHRQERETGPQDNAEACRDYKALQFRQSFTLFSLQFQRALVVQFVFGAFC
jgi:hypothetical protein